MKPRILATTIALLLTPSLFAVTDIWDGNLPNAGAGDSLFSNGLNWADNTAPFSDIANTDLIFAGTTKLAPIVGVAFSTNSIVFNNTAGAFSISGTTLSVGAGGIRNDDTQTQTFGNAINFGLVTTATVNAAGGALTFSNLVTAPTTLTVDGAFATTFFNILSGGSILKQGTGTMSWGAATPTDVDVTVTTGTMTLSSATTFTAASAFAVNGTSILNINQGATLDGAQLTRATGATLTIAAGETLAVQNGGDAIITGSFTNSTASIIAVTGAGSTFSTTSALTLNGGSTLNVSADGDVTSGTGGINIGTSGSGAAIVTGSGSSLSGGGLNVGLSGGSGLLTFSGGSTGAFGVIGVDNSSPAGTIGTLNIQSGATVTGTSLSIAQNAAANAGTATITGTGSALTLTGIFTSSIGAASASTGVLNLQSGGTLNSNAGALTIFATGTVAIAGGTFNANSNTIVNGQLTRDAAGAFNLAVGKTLTIQGGGDAIFTGSYDTGTTATNGGNIAVTGAGSTLQATAGLRLASGSTVSANLGGAISSSTFLDVGTNGAGTLTVDGAGSSASGPSFSQWGNSAGAAASVTFSNIAAGTFNGGLAIGATATNGVTAVVQVLSGADVSSGSVSLGTGIGTSSGSLTVDGAGSSWVIVGGGTLSVGSTSSTGTLTVSSGGLFTTGTGTLSVNAAGTVNLVVGTFDANGNVTVNGGHFTAAANGNFNLAASRTLSFTGGGVGNFVDHLALAAANAKLNVTGSGTTVTGGALQVFSNNTITVGSGADVLFTDLFLGLGASQATATITGAGSTFSTTNNTEIYNGTLTYSGGSSGSMAPVAVDADPAGLIGVAGTLLVQSGSTLTAGSTQIATTGFPGAANASAITVTGAGSAYTQGGSVSLQIGSSTVGAGISTGTLNVADGGTYTSGSGSIVLNTSGTINIDGGTLDLKGPLLRNGGTLNFNTGALKIIDALTIGTGGLLGTALTLDNTRSFTTTGTTTIDAFRTLTLNGGSFSTGALLNNGSVVFNSGTLGITGAGGLNLGTGPLGASLVLGVGSTLAVAQTTTIASGSLLRLNGGAFTGLFVVNNGTLDHQDGTLNIQSSLNNAAGGRMFVGGLSFNGGTITNAGRITLQNGLGEISGAGSIQNTGIITGDGTIGKAVTNSAGGQLRAEAGKTLFFTGAIATNAGTFSLEGGTLEFTNAITNGALGVINGFGALRSALLTNQGNIGLSGDARFYGDVTNTSGARIITSGGSTTTFYDDVIHNGAEIRTSAGGASVFFGAVSGAGPFTGTGTVYFEGDLRPGNSPASVLYEGDLVFGGGSSLTLEIGGLLSGSQYDHLNIGGALHADGDLVLALLGGFTPQVGDTFDLFDVGTFAGDFDSISAPALAGGNAWDFSALKTTGSVTVVPEPGIGALLLSALGWLGLRRSRPSK